MGKAFEKDARSGSVYKYWIHRTCHFGESSDGEKSLMVKCCCHEEHMEPTSTARPSKGIGLTLSRFTSGVRWPQIVDWRSPHPSQVVSLPSWLRMAGARPLTPIGFEGDPMELKSPLGTRKSPGVAVPPVGAALAGHKGWEGSNNPPPV